MTTREAFTKIIRIGTQPGLGSLFCRISWDGERLSITGVEGPRRNGDANGGCGQIVMSAWDITKYAPGWDAALVERFRGIWKEWHLNDLQAGSPAQTAYLNAHPVTDLMHRYEAACRALEAAGLQPDPGYMHNGKPYSYGSAWLMVEVPTEVLDFLRSLPDTDKTPAWV